MGMSPDVTRSTEWLELRQQILDKAVVHGRVTLSSGREADYYIDLRRVTLDGVAAPLVGQVMNELTADWDYQAVGGLTLGADPVATAMLHARAIADNPLDAFVVRKSGKAHGLQQQIEGPSTSGRRVLAVEDTSTTGSSVMAAACTEVSMPLKYLSLLICSRNFVLFCFAFLATLSVPVVA